VLHPECPARLVLRQRQPAWLQCQGRLALRQRYRRMPVWQRCQGRPVWRQRCQGKPVWRQRCQGKPVWRQWQEPLLRRAPRAHWGAARQTAAGLAA
jgi:hypothetical protein